MYLCLGAGVGEGAIWAPRLSPVPVSPKRLPAPLARPGPGLCAGEEGQFPAPGGLPEGACPPPSPNNGAVVPSPPPSLHPSLAPEFPHLS